SGRGYAIGQVGSTLERSRGARVSRIARAQASWKALAAVARANGADRRAARTFSTARPRARAVFAAGGAPAVWLRSRRAAVPSLGIASKGSRGLLGHAGPRRSRDRRATSRARPHDAAGSGAIELRAVPRPGDRIEEAMASSANDEDRVDERDAGESDRLALTPYRTVVVVGGGIVG